MTDQELYLGTIEDLEARLAKSTEYDIIRAAALLRHLLIDGPPLVHLANRGPRLRLVFREFQVPDLSHLGHWGIPWNSGDNVDFPSNNLVDLDRLLASKCLFVKGHHFSVIELIKLWAYVRGGVHSGKPDEREQAIQIADETTLSVDADTVLSVSAYSMRQIIAVAIEGLRPLTAAIKTAAGGN